MLLVSASSIEGKVQFTVGTNYTADAGSKNAIYNQVTKCGVKLVLACSEFGHSAAPTDLSAFMPSGPSLAGENTHRSQARVL
jgi:hypothetical protein